MDENYGTFATENRGFIPAIDTIAPGIIEQARSVAVEGEDWVSAVSRAMATVAMADYQRRLLNVQLDRARQGLPPLAASEYGVGVSVGIDPATRNMLLIGGVALVAFLLLARRRA